MSSSLIPNSSSSSSLRLKLVLSELSSLPQTTLIPSQLYWLGMLTSPVEALVSSSLSAVCSGVVVSSSGTDLLSGLLSSLTPWSSSSLFVVCCCLVEISSAVTFSFSSFVGFVFASASLSSFGVSWHVAASSVSVVSTSVCQQEIRINYKR